MKYLKKEPVLVYQAGKVASSAIVSSLEHHGIPSMHLHNLSGMLKYKQVNCKKTYSFFEYYSSEFKALIKSLLLRVPNRELKVIILVRDPILRNISMMFQISHLLLFEYLLGNSRNNIDSLSLFSNIYNEVFKKGYILEWFDTEIKKYLGVDVFNYTFDKVKGYTIIKQNHVNLLLMKYESLNESVIGDFVGIDGFKLENNNNSNQKWYSSQYKEFIDNYKFSEEELKLFFENKYCTHFYQEAEIENFYLKYSKQS